MSVSEFGDSRRVSEVGGRDVDVNAVFGIYF